MSWLGRLGRVVVEIKVMGLDGMGCVFVCVCVCVCVCVWLVLGWVGFGLA